MGVGESCRLAAGAIRSADIPFGIVNYEAGNYARNGDRSWVWKEIAAPFYNVNLFHVNADQMSLAWRTIGEETARGRYNIGYWHWELPEFPDEYAEGFRHLNEIWVPTKFIQASVTAKSPVPVVRIPHGIRVDVPDGINRQTFGLPDRLFLFLCMYDTFSFSPRKNPFAVIEAYKRAIRQEGLPAGLVIKVNNPDPQEVAKLRETLAGEPNVFLIDRVLGRGEANALIRAVDCVVSLHRSEGFGLPLAEAMYLGKPVIGTNWSGNTDFMDASNSCAVQYRLVRIGRDYGPYKAHQYWADPDLEHASYYMCKLVRDAQWRAELAAAGQRTIRTYFSPDAVGKAIRERLAGLRLL
ncbi:glycosyl transferase family 1 [Paenibacillus flagellatus]|uniref:Glycosyl transferase family 1 n=2 Tax=Paenibacillus flagellatus TaxID=2211139 RepID=A0A2V5K353_9BACL|nr:glycosyl transferase family 1 [Paenibacillus flagellatus]